MRRSMYVKMPTPHLHTQVLGFPHSTHADGEEHGVELRMQHFQRQILSDSCAQPERCAQSGDDRDLSIEDAAGQLAFVDAVAQDASCFGMIVENRAGMALLKQMVRGG